MTIFLLASGCISGLFSALYLAARRPDPTHDIERAKCCALLAIFFALCAMVHAIASLGGTEYP